jgi:hypothetical protein
MLSSLIQAANSGQEGLDKLAHLLAYGLGVHLLHQAFGTRTSKDDAPFS